MASALARLCSRAWQRQQQQQLVHSRLAAIVLAAPSSPSPPLPPQPPSSSSHSFHTSAPALMGRKGGASAFEKRQPPSSFRAQAARQKRVQQQEQEKRRRQLQQRQRRAHPGNRQEGGSSSSTMTRLPALADPEHLLDPDFADLIQELLRPVEDGSAPPSPADRLGRRAEAAHDADPLLLGEGAGVLSKEEALGRVDLEGKRREMAAREAETGVPCPVEEYDRLIRAYGMQDRPDEAVALLREMQDRGLPLSSRTLTAAVYALCRASAPRPEEAEALMAEMEGAGVAAPDVWTWTTLIKGYVRARRAEEALGAFRKMKLAGHQQDLAVCTAVLEALGKTAPASAPGASSSVSPKDRMLDFWMEMRMNGVEPDAVAYTVLMKALVRTGDIERALSFLDEMEQMGVEPTIVTYNTVLLAAAEAPLWFPGYNAYVYELLGRVEASNLAPNAETYRALLRVCAQAANPFLAERYLEQMQEAQGLEPGREHYHALLQAYARAQSAGAKGGRIPKLRGVADGGGDGAGVTSIAGRRLLGDGDKGKDEDVEIDLKAAAAQRALLPAEGKRSKKRRALRELGQALEKEEEGEAAAATAAGPSSSSGGRKVDASSLLLHVEGEEDEGLVPSAAALAVAGADVDVLDGEEEEEEGAEGAVVLRGGLLHRLPSERERLKLDGLVPFEEGQREMDLVRSRLPSGIRITELQEANIRAAHAVLREMRERGLEPTTETMNHVLSVYAEGLRIRRTLELVEAQYTAPTKIKKANSRANDDARLPVAGGVAGGPGVGVGVSPVPADAKTYQIVVRMLVRAKRLGEAFQLVKSLRRDKGITPSADTLGVMAEALGRRGEVKPALHLLEVMREDLGYEPKEWHVRALRRAMQQRGLRHPLVPKDPRTWLKEGLQLRKNPDKAGRRVRNLVASQMRAGP